MTLLVPFLFSLNLHAQPAARDAFVCAALLEHARVQPADAEFDRSFGLLQIKTHRKMQEIFGRAARGLEKIRTLLELTGSWGRARTVRLDDPQLAAMGGSPSDQRRLKTITHRLWRVQARTPVAATNLVAAREVVVGEAAIRQRLTKIRAAALRLQAEYDAAELAPPTAPRLNPWHVTSDVFAVLASGALSIFNTASFIHALAGGNYVWAAAHAGVFYTLARPVLRAKVESLVVAGRQWWRRFKKSEVAPRAAADAQLAHVDEVLKLLRSKSKATFAYFGSTIDLDLRKTGASTHPFRRTAPTAEEIRRAALDAKGQPAPLDGRRLEVDAVFRYDEQLENFVYAVHAWEPQYSTESKLWGW